MSPRVQPTPTHPSSPHPFLTPHHRSRRHTPHAALRPRARTHRLLTTLLSVLCAAAPTAALSPRSPTAPLAAATPFMSLGWVSS